MTPGANADRSEGEGPNPPLSVPSATSVSTPSELADQRLQVGALFRSVPRAVWLVALLHLLMLANYSIMVPAYRPPDEVKHVDLARAAGGRLGYEEYNGRMVAAPVLSSLSIVRYEVRSFNLLRREAPVRSDRPSFTELGADAPSHVPNQLTEHPPLYYAILGGVSAVIGGVVPGGEWAFDRVVGFLRLLNVLLVAGLPLLTYLLIRRLRGSEPVALAGAVFLLGIPQLQHIGSAVNNDNGLTILIGSSTLLCAAIAGGDSSARTAALFGVLGGLALLTKGFALLFPAWAALAYAYSMRSGVQRALAARRATLCLSIAFLIGGWWWLRNQLRYGVLQPAIDLLPHAPADFDPDLAWWIRRFVAWMPWRFWGWFGGFDVRLSRAAVVVATLVVLVGLVAALVRRALPRGVAFLLLFPAVSIAGITAAGSYGGYLETGLTPGIQGRYLFPGLVGGAAVVTMGLALVFGSRVRAMPFALLLGAGAMHIMAVRVILETYWADPSASLFERIRALVAWSPWPGEVVGVLWGLTLVTGLIVCVALIRAAFVPRWADGLAPDAEDPRSDVLR